MAAIKRPRSEESSPETKENPTKRARLAYLIGTPLATIFRVLQNPQPENACGTWWGNEPQISENVAMMALITCVMYHNIDMRMLLKSWRRVISEARGIYNNVSGLATPLASIRVSRIWQAMRAATRYVYHAQSPNFLYDFLVHGSCQCSCGSIAIYEIMRQVDPKLPMLLVAMPGHMLVAIQDSETQVNLLETTTSAETLIEMPRDEFFATPDVWKISTPELEAAVMGREWLRTLTFSGTSGGTTTFDQQKEYMRRIYAGLPVEENVSTAASVFRQLCGVTSESESKSTATLTERVKTILADMRQELQHTTDAATKHAIRYAAVYYQQVLKILQAFPE